MSWSHELRTYLIRSGTIGISMTELLHLFKNNVTSHEINAELEGWRSEEKAQKFKKPSKGRPQQIWRATTKMLEEDNEQPKGEEDD